jgi:hypothetical protein
MALDQLTPASVAQARCRLCRTDDIGEENGGEHAVEHGLFVTDTSNEALDFASRRCRISVGTWITERMSRTSSW